MTELSAYLCVLLWQPQPPKSATDAIQVTVTVGLFLVAIIVAMFFVFRAVRPRLDRSASDSVREELDRSKEALLLAAQAKKATREIDESATRQQEAEEKERELLRENVDPQRVIGRTCPLSALEMMADQELVIDPYTGQGYHLSSFLNDWPPGQHRPKYVYRYPQGTVVSSDQLVRDY